VNLYPLLIYVRRFDEITDTSYVSCGTWPSSSYPAGKVSIHRATETVVHDSDMVRCLPCVQRHKKSIQKEENSIL
jgi:hypothetical protein